MVEKNDVWELEIPQPTKRIGKPAEYCKIHKCPYRVYSDSSMGMCYTHWQHGSAWDCDSCGFQIDKKEPLPPVIEASVQETYAILYKVLRWVHMPFRKKK